MHSVSLISLGCPKNLVDSEVILGKLIEKGFLISEEPKGSDILIINTCGFIKPAVEESYKEIKRAIRWKREEEIKKIFVVGCLVQRLGKFLKREFPEIDGFFGIDFARDVNLQIKGIKFEKEPRWLPCSKDPRLLSTFPYAYLKIADGCDNFCSYCTLPEIKGRYRSREMEDIWDEAKRLRDSGIKELILIAQDTTLYGKDIYGKLKLPELLNGLSKIEGIEWLRLLYTYPGHYTKELLDIIKDEPKIVKYVDIPLQHISDKLLKRMNRHYRRRDIEELLSRLKEMGIAVRTTFIVGFPGEEEKDFLELMRFIEDWRFENLGCFEYYREKGTPAYRFKEQIPGRIKTQRRSMLLKRQREISLGIRRGFIGEEMEVLIEGFSVEGGHRYMGRTYLDAPEIDGITYVKAKDKKIGEFLRVKITETTEYDLYGYAIP